jgi:hypothetical protein
MSEIVKACAAGVSDKAGLLNAPTKHTKKLQPGLCEHPRHHQPARTHHDGTSSTRDDIAHKQGWQGQGHATSSKLCSESCHTHMSNQSPPIVPGCLNCAVSTIFVDPLLLSAVSVRVQKPFAGLIPVKCPLPPPSSHRHRFKTTPHATLQCSSPLPPAAPPRAQSVNAMPSMSLFMCPRFQDQVGDACVGPKHPRPLFGMLPMCRLSSR